MRDIIFRGKLKFDEKQWIYGGIVHQTDYYGEKVDKWFIIDGTETQDNDIGYEYRVIPETIGQCTGIKDKNGKLIFDGDIVYISHLDRYGTVEWQESEAKYVVRILGYRMTMDECEYEVIGNMHDNPGFAEV